MWARLQLPATVIAVHQNTSLLLPTLKYFQSILTISKNSTRLISCLNEYEHSL